MKVAIVTGIAGGIGKASALALAKIGYNGVFNYELGVTLEEVKANFDELFTTYNQGE